MAVRVLVVEDEAKVAHALRDGLTAEHFEVVLAATGEEGFYRANTETFDVVILDVMMPRRNGLEILANLRKRGVHTAVVLLTARDSIDDRVLGLDVGADDYLIKPFAFPELLARLRALLRRGRGADPLKFNVADLEIDLVTRRTTRGGVVLDLTKREFELLEYLMRHAGQLVSREMLTRDVWREPDRVTPLDNVIDVHIARVRKKVDPDSMTKLIHTVRGVGFVLQEGDR